MKISIGPITVDAKGLPRIDQIAVYPTSQEVIAYLASTKRCDIERWAKRLGVEVKDSDRPVSGHWRHVTATVNKGGYLLRVDALVYTADPQPSGSAS
jgi:hypothetical protein